MTYNEWLSKQSQSDTALLLLFGVVVACFVAYRLFSKVQPTLFMIAILGASVRLVPMPTSLWYDETFTAGVAKMSLDNLWLVVRQDVHPPTWYVLEWLNVRLFAPQEIAFPEIGLRAPSWLLGVFSIYVMYRLARAVGHDERVALWASLMVALLPAHVFYSNEARQYMLLTVAVWCALWGIYANKPWALLIVGALPLIHTHGFIYALVIFGWVFFNKPWLKQLIIGGFVSLIWLPFAVVQSADVANGFWLAPFQIPDVIHYFVDTTLGVQLIPEIALGAIVVTMALVVMAVLKTRKTELWFVVFMGVPLVTAGLSMAWHNVFLIRALLPAGLLIVIAWGALLQNNRVLQVIAVSTFGVATLVAIGIPSVQRLDYRNYLTICNDPTIDNVYVVSPQIGVIASYYTNKPVYIWKDGQDLNQYLSNDASRAFGMIPVGTAPNGVTCVIDKVNQFNTPQQKAEIAKTVGDNQGEVVIDNGNMSITITVVNHD